MIRVLWRDFIDSLDYAKVFRRGAFVWVLWLTTQTFAWAMKYAMMVPPEQAAQAAAMIAAILTPVAGVQAWVLKIYLENTITQIKLNKQEREESGV